MRRKTTAPMPLRSPGGVLTPPGMAHWAGTGPIGTTCRECSSWITSGRWSDAGPGGSGEPLAGRCRAYKRLGMLKTFGPPISHATPSCKFFAAAKKAQPIKRPERIEADWLA